MAVISLVTGSAGEGGGFLAIWLLFWAAAWVIVGTVWLWNLYGREVVIVDAGALTIWSELLGRRFRRRDFPDTQITRLRAIGYFGSHFRSSGNLAWWGLTGGTIAFETGGKTERFGIQLEEWEARDVVERVAPFLPSDPAA